MRILHINWAPIHFSAKMGGGANLYCHDIAVEQRSRGHEVVSLTSGLVYDVRFKPYLRRLSEEGIESYQIVNSPAFAPGQDNFDFPLSEVSGPSLEKVFLKALQMIRPNVVHFHNIEGFTLSCIGVAKRFGARVIFSLHNYHLVCSQVTLLYKDRELCLNFEGGARCVTCICDDEPRAYRLLRRVLRSNRIGLRLLATVRRGQYFLRRIFTPFFSLSPKGVASLQYRLRRETAIAALNTCDRVLAVSSFVGKLFLDMGVAPGVLSVMPIGLSIATSFESVSRPPDSFAPGGTVRLTFLGYGYESKGFPVLLKALKLCGADVLKQVHLTVAGTYMEMHASVLAELSSTLAGLDLHSGYDRQKLTDILRNTDVGIVPPVWWDNAPQVVFEFLAYRIPVVASRIGGIPDFIQDEVNGLLLTPGDAAAMAAAITRIVQDPSVLPIFSSHIQMQKSIPAHVDELERVYRD